MYERLFFNFQIRVMHVYACSCKSMQCQFPCMSMHELLMQKIALLCINIHGFVFHGKFWQPTLEHLDHSKICLLDGLVCLLEWSFYGHSVYGCFKKKFFLPYNIEVCVNDISCVSYSFVFKLYIYVHWLFLKCWLDFGVLWSNNVLRYFVLQIT